MKKNKIVILSFFLLVLGMLVLYSQDFNAALVPYSQPIDIKFDNNIFIPLTDDLIKDLTEPQFSKDYRFNYLTYDPLRDPKRLAYDTGLIFGASLIEFAVLWSLPENTTKWNKEEKFSKERLSEIGLTGIWKENIEAGPVWDQDGVFFNWICHPWVGAIYYMSARGSGYKKWESFSYSLFMSTIFWEFGVEAFAEIPSWQDMIITPVIGSLIGEQFFKLKKKIVTNQSVN